MIHKIKNVPESVEKYFTSRFVGNKYAFDFYWYMGMENDSKKVYGCHVFESGKMIHNATQATEKWFIEQVA